MKDWIEAVLSSEGFADWQVQISGRGGDGLCMQFHKIIFIGEQADKFVALHEIAHINAEGTRANTYHDGLWADNFTRLVRKYVLRPT